MRSGIDVLEDLPGLGPRIERRKFYDVRIRMWLHRGDPVRWSRPWGLVDRARLEDEGETMYTCLRYDREFMFGGLFYGVAGMRIGGTRRLRVAPHLAYRDRGINGAVPPNALLLIEVQILSARAD